jgi:hypothetical protein
MNIIHRFVWNSEIRPIETPPACQADAGSLWLRPSTVSAQRRNSIKNRVLAELACVVFLLSSISFSQKVVTATANIPFEFWAVGQKFAAGEYIFDSGFPGSTSIHREGTKSTVAVPIIPYGDPVKKEDARVVFVLRDGRYYLVEFWGVLDRRVVTTEFAHRGQTSTGERQVQLIYP